MFKFRILLINFLLALSLAAGPVMAACEAGGDQHAPVDGAVVHVECGKAKHQQHGDQPSAQADDGMSCPECPVCAAPLAHAMCTDMIYTTETILHGGLQASLHDPAREIRPPR